MAAIMVMMMALTFRPHQSSKQISRICPRHTNRYRVRVSLINAPFIYS